MKLGSESPITRRELYVRLGKGFDHLIDQKFKESVEIWPDDKPIPLGDGTYVMPADIEIIMDEVETAMDGEPQEEPQVRILQPGESIRLLHVNMEETMARLEFCPVCGAVLQSSAGYNLERSCSCGEFTLSAVEQDGDVTFQYRLIARWKLGQDDPSSDEYTVPG